MVLFYHFSFDDGGAHSTISFKNQYLQYRVTGKIMTLLFDRPCHTVIAISLAGPAFSFPIGDIPSNECQIEYGDNRSSRVMQHLEYLSLPVYPGVPHATDKC